MRSGRLEAFSDGVLAILITIMVLELKVPHGADLEALRHITPILCAYVLSFIYVGIYWNNHHHMLHTCERVSGGKFNAPPGSTDCAAINATISACAIE